jgi:transcriptional regulator with XRE-family HTH domain
MDIGKAIKELRKHKNLSQEELGVKASITQAALSQIENGKRPGIRTLKRISEALEVPVSLLYVIGMEKEDVPKEKALLYENLFPVIQELVRQIATKG